MNIGKIRRMFFVLVVVCANVYAMEQEGKGKLSIVPICQCRTLSVYRDFDVHKRLQNFFNQTESNVYAMEPERKEKLSIVTICQLRKTLSVRDSDEHKRLQNFINKPESMQRFVDSLESGKCIASLQTLMRENERLCRLFTDDEDCCDEDAQ
jgi:hypothetical protein